MSRLSKLNGFRIDLNYKGLGEVRLQSVLELFGLNGVAVEGIS